jgi:ribosome-binding factor A
MSESHRVKRVEKELRQIVGQFLIKGLKSPLPGVVSVVEIMVQSDLRSGKVFLSYIGPSESREETEQILAEEWPVLQRTIGKELKMKYVPKLKFFINQQVGGDAGLEQMIAEMNSKRDA